MRLIRAHIENFRSLQNVDINFSDYTIFVGKNNTGKSNVLKAIDLVIGEGYYRVSKNDFYSQNEDLTIIINLFFNSFTQDEKDKIKEKIRYRVKSGDYWYTPEEIHEELDIAGEIRIETEISPGNISKKLFIGDIYYRYLSNDLKNTIVNCIFIPSVRDLDTMTAMYKNSILNRLLKMVYENCPQDKRDKLYESLGEVSEKLKDIFETCESRLDEISKSIISHDGLNISIIPSDYEDIYKKLHVVLNDGVESELEYKGTGIQSVIIISLFKLYSELRIGSALLMLEEPESFLHPHACRHMSNVLKDIGSSENAQLIVTTHSPHNIINMNLKDVVLFKKNNSHTEKIQITMVENETKLKKELNSDNLELFFSEKVVLVEGNTDKRIIPVVAKKVNSDFDFDRYNISVIEMGSKTNLDVFASLLNSFEIPWVALFDRDFASKTESLSLLHKINNQFNFGFDIDGDTEVDLIQNLKLKGIFVLQYGEIENYYTERWLLGVLGSFIEDLSLTPGDDSWVRAQISQISGTTDMRAFKQNFFVTLQPEPYSRGILNEIINIKHELSSLDLDQVKMGNILSDMFEGLNLSKPKIAIRLLPYLELNDLPQPKRDDLREFVEMIFA